MANTDDFYTNLNASLKEQLKKASESLSGLFSLSTGVNFIVSQTKEAIANIKEVDTLLTKIGSVSNYSTEQLIELGNKSYEIASKYGISNTTYLTSVQEMNESGFYGEKGNQMAELSVLAQVAGDISDEAANSYLLAADAAYEYKGSIEKLNAVLDGQNAITNRSTIDMEAMAKATEKAGSTASTTGVKIDELSAMIGTIASSTKDDGEQVGTGLKSLLINLQNLNSTKIVETLNKANASMTETVNGVEQLRTPTEILKDLAETFNSLDANDPFKSEILTNIGQNLAADDLSALLSNWESYEKMLQDYSNGTGSAAEEANKTAASLEGSLNALNSTWNKIISNALNSDGLNTIVKSAANLLSIVEKLTSFLGSFGTVSTVLSGVLGAKRLGLTNYVTMS